MFLIWGGQGVSALRAKPCAHRRGAGPWGPRPSIAASERSACRNVSDKEGAKLAVSLLAHQLRLPPSTSARSKNRHERQRPLSVSLAEASASTSRFPLRVMAPAGAPRRGIAVRTFRATKPASNSERVERHDAGLAGRLKGMTTVFAGATGWDLTVGHFLSVSMVSARSR